MGVTDGSVAAYAIGMLGSAIVGCVSSLSSVCVVLSSKDGGSGRDGFYVYTGSRSTPKAEFGTRILVQSCRKMSSNMA